MTGRIILLLEVGMWSRLRAFPAMQMPPHSFGVPGEMVWAFRRGDQRVAGRWKSRCAWNHRTVPLGPVCSVGSASPLRHHRL